jgi:membrane-associated protease RseP (regulator of RpoE activity)
MLAKLVPSASFPMQQTPTDSFDSAGPPKVLPQDNTPGAIPMTPDIQAGSGWLFESKWVYGITNVDMNPLLMAAWVGLLVTGLNMIPISQLDGGHVIFGLLGEKSRFVSWTTYFVCVAYVIFGAVIYRQGLFVVMLILVSLMGVKHPPSRNDNVPVGFFRQALGWCTLLLPILCIPMRPVTLAM